MGAEEDRAALLAALRLQIEWGADEALADSPLDRTAAAAVATLPPPGASFPAAARAPATAGPGSPLARPAARSGGALLLPAAAPPAASRAAELADAAGNLDALRDGHGPASKAARSARPPPTWSSPTARRARA